MLFNSLTFFVFFIVVLLGYPIIPRYKRHVFLLAVSLIFYMGWNVKYILLITISIITTFACGLFLDKANSISKKNLIVALCFIINLAILFFFKYFNFFVNSVNSILSIIGAQPVNVNFDVLLPVGISFYSFQALGYIIDVYRGDLKGEKNFAKYALFVTFFPQLVAGPIERSKNLLDQIHDLPNQKLYRFDNVKSGLITMLWGYFIKVVIADRAAILVDTIYDNYWVHRSFALVIATLVFAIQIYCDFSAYSTIAIGASRVLGFSLMENFNTPYFSRSIKEFWRRWHISLSTWFRDYLYIPLGGNRTSKLKGKINVFVVFLTSGLWHGANWTFVAWGFLHGAYQVIGDLLKPLKKRLCNRFHINTKCFSFALGQTLVTCFLVCFAWIFFRAATITDALIIIKRIIFNLDFESIFNGTIYTLGLARQELNILLGAVVVLFLVDSVKYLYNKQLEVFLAEQNLWFEWAVLIALFMSIIIFGAYGPGFEAQQFIYFQF